MVVLAMVAFGPAASSEPSQDGDLAKRLKETYAAAAEKLVAMQDSAGAWKMGPEGKQTPSPSSTGLIVASLASAPEPIRTKFKDATAKGLAYILSRVNEDGSIGEGPTGTFLKTYTTAICLVALSSVERTDKVADVIRGAQAYLKNNQLKEGMHAGGVGYGDAPKDPAKMRGDLSVTGFAAEGLKVSGLPQDDEFWKLVVQFVRKCQNNSEVNNDPAFVEALKKANMAVGNDGGLYYTPVASDKASLAERLVTIHDGLARVVEDFAPDEAAVEATFVNKDANATLKLGQARGVALLIPARSGISVAEYAPNLVKKTIVGAGHCEKEQIRSMLRVLLPKADPPSHDAADALAIAVCHAHHAGTRRLWSIEGARRAGAAR